MYHINFSIVPLILKDSLLLNNPLNPLWCPGGRAEPIWNDTELKGWKGSLRLVQVYSGKTFTTTKDVDFLMSSVQVVLLNIKSAFRRYLMDINCPSVQLLQVLSEGVLDTIVSLKVQPSLIVLTASLALNHLRCYHWIKILLSWPYW